MSVTSCITLHFGKSSPIAAYKSDLSGDVADLVADGMTPEAAWLQVVDAKVVDLRAEKARIEQVVADAYAKTAAGKPVEASASAAATHKDPGEPAEAVTPAVVADAIKTGVQATDRKPSEMKAEMLAKIDAAVKEAIDYTDFEAVVKTMGLKDATAVFTDAKGTFGDKVPAGNYTRPNRTFKVEGDGVFTIQNTVRQLLTFRAKVESSPGFSDRKIKPGLKERATDALDRRSQDQAIANMIDEGDFEAAQDYAAAVGADLADVKLTKVLRERLDKWQRDTKMAADVAEFEARKPQDAAAPEPASMAAEAEPAPAPAEPPAAAGIASQTFDQWVRAKYDGNEYKARYLEEFEGNEKRAILGAALGTIDNERKSPDLLKEARAKYHGELLALPRETRIGLDVWDALGPLQYDAQRHFYDLDARITRRTQDETKARVAAETAKKAPYEAAFAEVDAEIRRLDKIDGPETQKQKDLSARRDRLREALYQIGQGKEPDGRLLKSTAQEAAPAAAEATTGTESLNKRHSTPKKQALTPGGSLKADATNSKADSSVWYYQGDMGALRFTASVTMDGKPDPGADRAKAMLAQIAAAQDAGWKRANYRAGSLGTVWVFERGGDFLTRAGMENAAAGVLARPVLSEDKAGFLPMATQQFELARAFDDWLNTLPAEQQDNRGVVVRKMGETPVGEWARIEDDNGGVALRYYDKGGLQFRVGFSARNWGELRAYVRELAARFDQSRDASEYEIGRLISEAGREANAAGPGTQAPDGWVFASGLTFTGSVDAEATRLNALADGREYKAFRNGIIQRPAPAAPATLADRVNAKRKPAEASTASKTPTVDAHQELFKAVRAGTATPDEFKAMYARVRDGKDTLIAELNTSTKDELLKGISGQLRPGTTKGELVGLIYTGLLRRFALGKDFGPNSYIMGNEKAYEKAKRDGLDALVEGQTAESLAEYAAEAKAEFDAEIARRTALLDSIKVPKTLEDFQRFMRFHGNEGKTFKEARFMLTPEQRAAYDDMAAEASRGKRKASTDADRSRISTAGQSTTGEVIATKHTRDGHDLWVVKLADRVSKEDYGTLLAGAKRLGGNYSSYRGGGAIPGFQFRTPDAAQAFLKLAGGDKTDAQAVAAERRDAFADDRSQSATERLTEMADRLEERADESLGRDRKTNTSRRAGQAASAEAAASADKAMAMTMRNLATAIGNGAAKFLDRVRQKVQVEMLQNMLRTAQNDELRAKFPAYIDQERNKGNAPTFETADFAEFPTFTAYRSDLASLARQLLEVDGTKLIGQRLMKVADDVSDAYLEFAKANFSKVATFSSKTGGVAAFGTSAEAERAIARSGYKGKAIAYQVKRGEHTVIMSPSEAMARNIWKGDGDKRITLDPDLGAEMVEKIGRAARRGSKVSVPWQLESAYDRRKALARMGIETPAEMRAALREFVSLREQAAAPDKVKQLERAMIGRRNDGMDFFPTPEATADEMVAAADIQPGMRVLEPSAGWGHIAERIRAAGFEPDVGEMSSDRRELLEAKGFNVVGRDFMDTKAPSGFTYGDTFRAPDGKVGIMRGLGGMGSDRVRLVVDGDERTAGYYSRGDLEPIKRNGVGGAGALVPRADLERLEALPTVRGDVLSSVRSAIVFLDRGDYEGAASLMDRATRQAEFNPDALEQFSDIVDRLLAASEASYDRILMNPPFSDGRDIQHVRHAFDLLKPGGRVVAIMGESAFTNQNKRATEFREWLESVGGTEEKLPDGTFLDSDLPVNTGANARMVVIDKPGAEPTTQFSRSTGRGIPMKDANAVAQAVREALPTAPQIIVHESVNQAPQALRDAIREAGAENDVEAALHEGEIHVFPQHMASIDRMLFVVKHHEIRHYGMRALFPEKRLGTILLAMYQSNKGLRDAANAKISEGLTTSKITATDEALADLPVEDMLKLNGWDKIVAAFRQWRRDLAARLRIKQHPRLADMLDVADWTDRDVAAMVRRAENISRGGGGGFRTSGTVFSQDQQADDDGAMFSRASPEAIQRKLREALPAKFVDWVQDGTSSQRGFNRWGHRTVGTQLHKAKINKEFGRVFYAVQDFMRDVSRIATHASDLAPDMLVSVDDLAGLRKIAPTLVSPKAMKKRKADLKAASDAMFDGTSRYMRNEDGKPVLVTEDQRTEAGLVWTDDELKARGASPEAIKMYRQSREAIGQSLDSLLAADILKRLSTLDPAMVAKNSAEYDAMMAAMRRAVSSDTPGKAIDDAVQALEDAIARIDESLEGQPNQYTDGLDKKRQILSDVLADAQAMTSRVAALKNNGYAPLMRFGPYVVDILTPEGGRAGFRFYESQMDANRAAREMREQGYQVKQSIRSEQEYKMLDGLSPDVAMMFAELLGVEKNDAMQAYLQNALAEQSALKRRIRRKNVEGFNEDGQRVLAAFITSNARAASRGLHSAEVQNSVDSIVAGDVKDEAIALANYINDPKEEAQAVRSLLFVNYIGGSIASALVNLTQTFVQTYPFLAQYGGPVKAAVRVTAAMRQAAGKIADPDLARAIKQAEDDGTIKPQEIFQLQAEASRSLGSNLYARSFLSVWGSMFQAAEGFNRRTAFIAAYQTAKAEGMPNPMDFAKDAVDQTQGIFNKGNRPNWSRGALGATVFTFKTFTIQYVEFLVRLSKAGPEGKKSAALALGMLIVLAGVRGLPFAGDAEDLLDAAAQAMGYNFTTRSAMNDWAIKTLGEDMADVLQNGFSGFAGMPFDVSQRLGMADLLPGTGILKKSETRKEDQVLEAFGVAGSFVRDALRGEVRPIAIRNLDKAIDIATTGMYRDTRGRKVIDASGFDAFMKALGLQPGSVARESRAISGQYELQTLFKVVKGEISEQMALGRFEGDAEKVKAAQEAMEAWNEQNPEARIQINSTAILRRVLEMRKDRRERFLNSSPREIRPSLAESL